METESNERAEQAWLIWSTDGHQDDAKTAELSGIPRRTIAYYRSTRGWPDRLAEAMGPQARGHAVLARQRARLGLTGVVERLLFIAYGQVADRDPRTGEPTGTLSYASDDRNAIQAAKLLGEWGYQGLTGEEADGAIEARYGVPNGGSGDTSAADQVAQILTATVASVNTRAKRGRRV